MATSTTTKGTAALSWWCTSSTATEGQVRQDRKDGHGEPRLAGQPRSRTATNRVQAITIFRTPTNHSNTVKTHVRHTLAKLDLRDRVQAIVLAHENGLPTVPGESAR